VPAFGALLPQLAQIAQAVGRTLPLPSPATV